MRFADADCTMNDVSKTSDTIGRSPQDKRGGASPQKGFEKDIHIFLINGRITWELYVGTEKILCPLRDKKSDLAVSITLQISGWVGPSQASSVSTINDLSPDPLLWRK